MSAKKTVTYQQAVCGCGHDEDSHNLGFFVSGRPCKVTGCKCGNYVFARNEPRTRTT